MTGYVENQQLAALQTVWKEQFERFGQRCVPKKLQLPDAVWSNEEVGPAGGEDMPPD